MLGRAAAPRAPAAPQLSVRAVPSVCRVTGDGARAPRVAFATAPDSVVGPNDTDRPFHDAACAAVGIVLEHPVWSDPSVPWDRYDLVVVRSVWDYLDHLEEFRAWLVRLDGLGTLHNPAPVIDWNLDKRYLARPGRHRCPGHPHLGVRGRRCRRCGTRPGHRRGGGQAGGVGGEQAHRPLRRRRPRGRITGPSDPRRGDRRPGPTGRRLGGGRGGVEHGAVRRPGLPLGAQGPAARTRGWPDRRELHRAAPARGAGPSGPGPWSRRRPPRSPAWWPDGSGSTSPCCTPGSTWCRWTTAPTSVLEVELAEPSFFLRAEPAAAGRFAAELIRRAGPGHPGR